MWMLLSLIAALNLTASADDILKMGSPAPALHIENWVRGEGLETFQPGQVYVVEFWATWCGPCVDSIPELKKFQTEYAAQGLHVIGIAADERGDAEKDLAKVNSWLSEHHPDLNYPIAFDSSGRMKKEWTERSLAPGIPESFVVDRDGTIAFIGHPAFLPEVLPKVLAGEWRESEKALLMDREQLEQRLAMKKQEEIMQPIYQEIGSAEEKKDWPTVLSLVEKGLAASPDDFGLHSLRLTVLLNEVKDFHQGFSLARERVSVSMGDPWALVTVLEKLFHPSEPRGHLPSEERFQLGSDISRWILEKVPMESGEEGDMVQHKIFYYGPVAQYYYERKDTASAIALLESALKQLERNPMRDKFMPVYGLPLAQALADYKGEPVCVGDTCLTPQTPCEKSLSPQ